jgi:hypothetical protein
MLGELWFLWQILRLHFGQKLTPPAVASVKASMIFRQPLLDEDFIKI